MTILAPDSWHEEWWTPADLHQDVLRLKADIPSDESFTAPGDGVKRIREVYIASKFAAIRLEAKALRSS